METPETNSFFYRYFQMAYEYINGVSEDSVQGSVVYYRLLRKRIESLLDNAGLPDEDIDGNDARLDTFKEWFAQKQRENIGRITNGNLDDFNFKPDEINQSIQEELKKGIASGAYQNTVEQKWSDLGMESYATYLPMHFFYDGKAFTRDWGIYISNQGILRIAALLYAWTKDWPRNKDIKNIESYLISIAFEILLRHELEHFKIESFALNAELVLHKPVYTPYIMKVYAKTYPNENCLEEAAANSTILYSRSLNFAFLKVFQDINKWDWIRLLEEKLFKCQPPCYRNTSLNLGWDEHNDPFKNIEVSYANGRRDKLGVRTRGMNYLCNQILTSAEEGEYPSTWAFNGNVPFFAFMPDNYFLRAENLVPIHIVQSLDPDDCMIGITYPKEKEFLDFIVRLGFSNDRSNKHKNWQSPYFKNPLNLSFHDNGEIDHRPFKSSLDNIGISIQDYMRYRQMSKDKKEVFINNLIAHGPTIPLANTNTR